MASYAARDKGHPEEPLSLDKLLRKIYFFFFPRPDLLAEHVKNGLTVGKNFSMQGGVLLDGSHIWHITIGDDVTLAPGVHLLAHDASTKKHLGYARIGRVTIGDNVFIGACSIVLPGVTIGSNVIIGAGSVVSRDIPDNSVSVGNPARVVCSMEDFLNKKHQELCEVPRFDESYTLRGEVTDSMKQYMNQRMERGIGYIE